MTVRSSMENFESIYGNHADIDRSSIPKDCSFDERTCIVRKMRMIWILKYKIHERKVKKLLKIINEGGYVDIEAFADDYATGYFELNEILKERLLTPWQKRTNNFSRFNNWPRSQSSFGTLHEIISFPEKCGSKRTIWNVKLWSFHIISYLVLRKWYASCVPYYIFFFVNFV